ncbi:nucleotidyltransferase family protein [Archaeoglobus sp.]
MIDVDYIKEIILKHKDYLKKKFNVKEIGLFGSYVRGEQKESSDIDILVEFEETPTLLEFVELENYLTELLGVKVDLVMKRALKPKIKETVLKEVVYI